MQSLHLTRPLAPQKPERSQQFIALTNKTAAAIAAFTNRLSPDLSTLHPFIPLSLDLSHPETKTNRTEKQMHIKSAPVTNFCWF